MLITLSNEARDYAWGSRSLLAGLEGRELAQGPEAEVWFGDHPADPSDLADGGTLDGWLAEHDERPLPYLLKLLAAASPLSIQVHPSKAQAEAGLARESALEKGAAHNYVDDNHKPELLVALSDRFEALCGLRELTATRRLVDALGPGASELRERLEGDDPIPGVLRWLLTGEAAQAVAGVIGSLADATSTEFAAELAAARRIATVYPDDPGVVVALLMNYIVLRPGEAVFLRAGMLHAYLSGLGVEVMAASDNVLRGGLTGKHVDVDELLRVVDPTPGPVPVVLPVSANGGSRGVEEFPVDVSDFALLRARVTRDAPAAVTPSGPAVVLVTAGEVTVSACGESAAIRPGRAVFVADGTQALGISGSGEAFIAQPGGRG